MWSEIIWHIQIIARPTRIRFTHGISYIICNTMNLSVIIPVYNEVHNINTIIKRVQDTKLATEIIIVDDGSKDGTRDILLTMNGKKKIRVILHKKNQGKVAAVITRIQDPHVANILIL